MKKKLAKHSEKILNGSAIIFLGTIIGMSLNFISRILLIRITNQSDYGTYALALTITTIFATISALGLEDGSTRYIAYFRGKKIPYKINEIASISIKIALISGILFFIPQYVTSEFISKNIFHNAVLSDILKIFSISIPFTVLFNVLIAVNRGFEEAKLKVYFKDLLMPILNILFLIVAYYLNSSLIELTYIYVMSISATCILFMIFTTKKLSLSVNKININNSLTKELLIFSIPLLGVQVLVFVMNWTDTLMIGMFKESREVGLYNAVVPLANMISVIVASVSYMYIPIASQLHSENQISEIEDTYKTLTKFIFVLSFPFFFAFYLYPKQILDLLYGDQYLIASPVLQIISFGVLINSGLGFAHNTLIAVGKSKLLVKSFIISSTSNIILNTVLIPPMGIIGASIATAISLVIGKMLNTIELYKYNKIHPFDDTYIRIVIMSFIFLLIFKLSLKFVTESLLFDVIHFILFLGLYSTTLVFTKVIDGTPFYSHFLKSRIHIEK